MLFTGWEVRIEKYFVEVSKTARGRRPRDVFETETKYFSIRTDLNDLIIPEPTARKPCEGTNSPRLFTPGETKALAKSKVHQISRAWVTVRGWSSSLISKIWRTVMNSEHCDWSNLKFAL